MRYESRSLLVKVPVVGAEQSKKVGQNFGSNCERSWTLEKEESGI